MRAIQPLLVLQVSNMHCPAASVAVLHVIPNVKGFKYLVNKQLNRRQVGIAWWHILRMGNVKRTGNIVCHLPTLLAGKCVTGLLQLCNCCHALLLVCKLVVQQPIKLPVVNGYAFANTLPSVACARELLCHGKLPRSKVVSGGCHAI